MKSYKLTALAYKGVENINENISLIAHSTKISSYQGTKRKDHTRGDRVTKEK